MSIPLKIMIALVLPLAAAAMIALGAVTGDIWWIVVGIVAGAVGILTLAGSPLVDLIGKGR
jgi:hypothetical protein